MELRSIRQEIANLLVNFRGLKSEIQLIRHSALRGAVEDLRRLKNSGSASRTEIQTARRRVQDFRTTLADTIRLKEEERAVIQCLRSCINSFYEHLDVDILYQDCVEVCG